MPAASYRFGDFRLDSRGMRLFHAERPVALEPKSLLTLLHLVSHPGRLIGKQELLEAVWSDVVVSDNSLTHAVAQIRKALGDDARTPRFVETAHALGYRFVGAVREEEASEPPAAPAFAPASARAVDPGATPSVAVLAFTDMSAAGDQEYLCDGIAEEIIDAFTRLEGLRVAARTSSFAYKGRAEDVREIGRRLGVGAVLEGSVRSADGRLRVTVQLIDVADGCHLWSERFDRAAGDLFALQEEIARGVARRLKGGLGAAGSWSAARRHAPGQEAYRLFLEGRFFLNRRSPPDLRRAGELFERATAADPAWAAPHQGLAETMGILGLWGFQPANRAFLLAKSAMRRALELDDSLLEARAGLASLLFLADWDLDGARRELETIRGVAPTIGLGSIAIEILLVALGRTEEALRLAQWGVDAEPASAIAHTQAGALRIGIGDPSGAVPLLEKALELDADLPMALHWLGFAHGVGGRLPEAIALLRRAVDRGLAAALAHLPAVLVRAGREREAREAAAELEEIAAERYTTPVARLLAWAGAGERRRCTALLAAAERERSPTYTFCLFCPGYLALSPGWLRAHCAARRLELLESIHRPDPGPRASRASEERA